MKKISTPSVSRQEDANVSEKLYEPRKKTLDFVRNFARVCQSLPLCEGRGNLSAIVLN